MHKSCLVRIVVLIICIPALITVSGMASDGWLSDLKNSDQPGRIYVLSAEALSEDPSVAKPVRMRHGTFYLESDFLPQLNRAKGHLLIQLSRPLNSSIEQQLQALGVELFEYIPENTWKVALPAEQLAALRATFGVRALGKIYPVDKFPPHMLKNGPALHSYNANGTISLLVSFYRDVHFKRVKDLLINLGAVTDQESYLSGHRVLMEIPPDRLIELSQYDEVGWIEDRPRPKINSNADAALISNVDDLHAAPYGLDGMGIATALWEGGGVQADHPDLSPRVTNVDVALTDSHATHVAGTMVSSGVGNPSSKGMAPAADLFAYDNDGDVPTEMSDAVSSFGILLANHSWGYLNGWVYNVYGGDYWVWFGDDAFGNYTSTSQTWDQTIVDTGLIAVNGAGNDRNDIGDDLRTGHYHAGDPVTLHYDFHPSDGPYSCIGQLGSSKNVITVGAVDDHGAMTSFSSYGPTEDGRIKPDMVANGYTVTSTCPIDSYCTKNGTSMATPAVSGSVALIAQHYLQEMGSAPTPEMVKALLAGTAFELGEEGPEYSFGWGLLDVKSAVDQVKNDSELLLTDLVGNAEVLEYPLTIRPEDKVVRVTAAWTDAPGSPAAYKALVNDMDLVLVDPDGISHYPWILDKDDPSLPAARGVNSVDNIEQVKLVLPETGGWTVRVTGTSIQSSQSFALVISLSNEFQVNSSHDWTDELPSAAGLSNGGFVVAWDSSDLLYTTVDTYGRVFDSQGRPVGNDFRLNQTTTNNQKNSALAGLSGGGFAAVWDSKEQDGNLEGVYGRLFDNEGNATTSEFRINVETYLAQADPSAAGLSGGGFVVAWESRMQDSSDWGIFTRLFDESGDSLTGDIQVNTTTFFDQSDPCIAPLTSGSFVVAWKSYSQDGSWYGIFGRVFDSTGTPKTAEFPVNTYTTSSQYPCAVAGLNGGGFVIVWKSYGQDGDEGGIFGQIFDASGNKDGAEFPVNTYTQNDQTNPAVSPLPNGGFIVLYQSYEQDGNYDGVYARKYDSSGTPEGPEYQLSTYSVHDQAAPCSATLAGGEVLAAWEGVIQGRGKEIFAKVMTTTDAPVIDVVSYDTCISECPTCSDAHIVITAHDPAGGNLSYAWTALNGGTILGSGSTVDFDPPDNGPHPCPYNVRVQLTSSVSGLSTTQTVPIRVKLKGDVDANGVVNILDKVAVRNAFGTSGAPGWIPADVDCNGVVNILDKVVVRNQFGQSGCACP